MAKRELVATIRDRCQQASKKEKGEILDEFTAIAGRDREHSIRLLSGTGNSYVRQAVRSRFRDEAVREAVIVVCLWEATQGGAAHVREFHGAARASESRSRREWGAFSQPAQPLLTGCSNPSGPPRPTCIFVSEESIFLQMSGARQTAAHWASSGRDKARVGALLHYRSRTFARANKPVSCK